jgi:hypothetical protein
MPSPTYQYVIDLVMSLPIRSYDGICRHNTEHSYNNKYIANSIVILAKRWLWLPDDGLCKPKHVGAAFMILIFLRV